MRPQMISLFAALILCTFAEAIAAQQGASLTHRRTISGDQLLIGHIGAITADARGRIYAAETNSSALAVIVFDSTGKLVTKFGRPGQGPGEHAGLAHTLAWAGDTLLTLSGWRARRLTGWNMDGSVAFTAAWPAGVPLPNRLLGGRGAAFGISFSTISTSGSQRVGEAFEATSAVGFSRVARGGAASRITTLGDTVPRQLVVQCASRQSGALPHVILPFRNPVPLTSATAAGEIVRGHLDKYQIDVIDPITARTIRSISRTLPTRRLAPEDFASTPEGADLLAAERESGGRLAADVSRTRDCPVYERLPQNGPPLRSVTADERGQIWVEVADPVKPGGILLHVFDQAGRQIADVEMPTRDYRVEPFVRGNLIYFVQLDDDDVQSIAVYQLRVPG